MLDIETLGNTPGSVIFSVGAVEMNQESGFAGTPFNIMIDPVSCEGAGLRCDSETVKWWFKQKAEARAPLNLAFAMGARLPDAMREFCEWVGPRPDEVWCFGASFDFPILEHAMRQCRITPPWSFRSQRCLRTLAAMRPEIAKPEGVLAGEAHTALHDAMVQALWWKLLTSKS